MENKSGIFKHGIPWLFIVILLLVDVILLILSTILIIKFNAPATLIIAILPLILGGNVWYAFDSIKILEKEPYFHILTRFGKYVKDENGKIKVFEGGDTFFSFFGFYEAPVMIDCSNYNFSGQVKGVRADKDEYDSIVEYDLTLKISPEHIYEFMGITGEIKERTEEKDFKKVQKVLDGMIAQAVIDLAGNEEKLPHVWNEIKSNIRGFIEAIRDKLISLDDELDIDKEKETSALLQGKAEILLENLGLIITRINITNIIPDPKAEEARESVSREEAETKRKAEIIKQQKDSVEGMVDQAQRIKKIFPNLTDQEVINAIQAQSGKSGKQIYTIEGNGGGSGTNPANIFISTKQ